VEVLVPSTCGFGARYGEHRYNHCKILVTAAACGRSCLSKAQRSASKQQTKPNMKRNLLAVAAAGAIALGAFMITQAQAGPGFGCGHGHAFGLQGITDKLNLTADQQTKVQPILDATKPQIAAIHQEAMQKMKTVVDGAMSQIRPLLTPEQQKKLDDLKKAHEDMRKAHEELRAAMGE
jgi:Spy/CpxP family protein refolding chaperone